MWGHEALQWCGGLRNVETVLDVGSGAGEHAKEFRRLGKQVVTLDASQHLGKPDILADFNEHIFDRTYDLVWACHVLEHQRNVGTFLEKIASCCALGGYIAITVPPAKHNIVGGHVTLWNAGLLLYNMVLAGIDCRRARVWQYGYNVSVVVEFWKVIDLSNRGLIMDAGDLEKLQDLFPVAIRQNANGLECVTV